VIAPAGQPELVTIAATVKRAGPDGVPSVTSWPTRRWCSPAKSLDIATPLAASRAAAAAAEVPFGAAFVTERAPIALFSGPLQDGHPQLLFFAEGEYPVLANIMFVALVLSARAPFGGLLSTTPPLIPSVPDGPDVALVQLQTTIGAKGITYYEHVHGRTIDFHPRGIVLPRSCPRGGFAFAAHLSFQDGTGAGAGAVVPARWLRMPTAYLFLDFPVDFSDLNHFYWVIQRWRPEACRAAGGVSGGILGLGSPAGRPRWHQ